LAVKGGYPALRSTAEVIAPPPEKTPWMHALTELQKFVDIDRIYTKGELVDRSRRRNADTIRIVSWNIQQGHDVRRLGEMLVFLQPDIACLQEVDWGNIRTGCCDVLQELAARTGMLGLYGVEFVEISNENRSRKFAGGGVIGNAILTRFPPRCSFRIEVPIPLDWERAAADPALPASVRQRVRREPRLGRRFGIAAEIPVGELELLVSSIHLEDKYGGVEGRWSQYLAAARALDERGDTNSTRVVAGDMNTFDSRIARLYSLDTDAVALGKPTWEKEATWWRRALLPKTGYVDPFDTRAWTFRVPPLFRAKLDWITIKNGVVNSFATGPFASSDHRPIWIDIKL
jgi:endonuclease/exonuclease/phosphatase family metal-dependent hydrolase